MASLLVWPLLLLCTCLTISPTDSAQTRVRKRQATPPVSAVWAEWGEWAACTVSCGGGGQTKRTRQCPLYGACGNPSGSTEKKLCGEELCITWTAWGEWGKCSITCGSGGKQLRSRTCSVGDKCVGDKIESKACCCLPACPVWATWAFWSSCSTTCGPGMKSRSRKCGGPYGTTPICPGSANDTSACSVQPCCTPWSDWGSCSLPCGGGVTKRNQTCGVDTGKTVAGSIVSATGYASKIKEEVLPCNNNTCPVWKPWTKWTPCTQSCISGYGKPPGLTVQSRECQIDSNYCVGDKLSTAACKCEGPEKNETSCNAHICPVWGDWNSWSDCSVSCTSGYGKEGYHTRWRDCKNDKTYCVGEPLKHDPVCSCGKNCTTDGANATEPCNTQKCPKWADWSSWGECSSSCTAGYGQSGTRQQIRTCKNDPKYCVADKVDTPTCSCNGSANNSESCNNFACPKWTEWSSWTECSSSCTSGYGTAGTHTQSRECKIDTTYCKGDKLSTSVCKCENNATTGDGANRTEPCNRFSCPKWSDWSSWTECSASCTAGYGAAGTHTQSRECKVDTTYCTGDKLSTNICKCDNNATTGEGANRTESCNKFACPKWSEWSGWSDCSVTCGGGKHSNGRECIIDKTYCAGDKLATAACKCENNATTGDGANKTESCNTFSCSGWTEWSSWSDCSASCAGGSHTQTRECKTDTTYCVGDKLSSNECQCAKNATTGLGANKTDSCNTFSCPKWSDWSGWTECSVSCGGGKHSQGRQCIIDKTYCTGDKLTTAPCKCENNATTGDGGNKTDVCNTFDCPKWGDWSIWSDCSLPCISTPGVVGSHKQVRGCKVDSGHCVAEKLGEPECKCVGNSTQSENCNNFACPVWNSWGNWSDCSQPCKANNSAAGTHTRQRTCKVDPQANCSVPTSGCPITPTATCVSTKKSGKRLKRDGTSTVDPCKCVGNDSDSESCNTFACPYWSEWGSWASCSVTCGGGTHQCNRNCITDPGHCTADKLKSDPQCKCDGSPSKNESCSTDACPTYKAWSDWGSCSVTCGNGTTNRKRECSRTDAPCVGNATDTQSCDKGPCYTWASWLSWSECSIVCGGGSRNRSRKCPREGGCPGLNVESSICNQTPCPEWGQWSQWASCSVTCGGGQRARTRSCPLKNGCKPGNPFEVDPAKCNTDPCPKWSEWTSWGSCSASCGEGNRRRNRTCSKDDGCPGRKEDVDPCSADPCPLVIPFSPWSECSQTCGGGTKTRTKSACVEGPPKCPLEDETAPCNEQVCPVWETWLPWSDCSATCGGGQRTRKRTCPVVNGCVGQATEIDGIPCNSLGCSAG